MNGNQNGGNTPKFIINPGNGEAKTSSLSGVIADNSGTRGLAQGHEHHSDTANLAATNSRSQGTPSGMRSEDYAKSLSNKSKNNGKSESSNKQRATALQNNVQNAKRMVAKEAIKKVGAHYGIPEKVSDKVLSTEMGQKAIDAALETGKMGAPLGMLRNAANIGKQAVDAAKNNIDKFADKHGSIGDETESASDKDAKRQEEDVENGEIRAQFNLQTIKWIAIVTPIVCVIFLFMIIVVGSLNEEQESSMILAGMVSGDEGREILKEVSKDAVGSGSSNLYGKGKREFPDEYYTRLEKLGNNYSNQRECTGSECLSRAEFLYYLKISDISLRYKNKYGITLDWFLISATDLFFARDTEDTMQRNLSNYDKNKVEDYDTFSELDWDNDFKNMSGYKYLDADDSRYDLNILAKNMVKKKTTQTCTDREGNVTKRQEDEDVEDMYFKPNARNYLKCGAGESYSIFSTYTKDMDKYDEFMLEYIDNKMFKAGSGTGSNTNANSVDGNSMSEAFVKLALEQLNDPSRKGGQKYKTFSGLSSSQPWCAAFVSWVIYNTEHDGKKLSDIIKFKSASTGAFMNHFYNNSSSGLKLYYNDNCSTYAGKNGSGTYTPKEGDLIFFDWQEKWNGQMPVDTSSGQDHIGIVQRTSGGVIYTIEGNSSKAVNERSYPINSCKVIAFGSWY